MGSESIQDRLGRNRPPRVHIHYKVQKGNAIELIELPFVVGVLAQLSGHRDLSGTALKDRVPTEVTALTLDKVLKDAAPELNFMVDNVIPKRGGGETQLGVNLKFDKMADFEPHKVAMQIEPLAALLREQEKLKELKKHIMTNPKLAKSLGEVVKDRSLLDSIIEATPPAAAAPEGQK